MRLQRQTALTDYDGFVEKFKPKKTTDDCYTPEPVYNAVAQWVRDNIPGLEHAEFIRPFWPGADYTAIDYPDGCCVVDNPPFSILARIVDDYTRAGIRYFLFAPALTLFNYLTKDGCTAVVCSASVTYGNGAVVSTSFLTNCWPGDIAAVVPSSLINAIKAANRQANPKEAQTRYAHDTHVTSSALLGKIANGTVDFEIPRDRCMFIRKAGGQAVFGSGLLLSDGMAQAAAQAAAQATAQATAQAAKTYTLTAQEIEVIRRLSLNDPLPNQ